MHDIATFVTVLDILHGNWGLLFKVNKNHTRSLPSLQWNMKLLGCDQFQGLPFMNSLSLSGTCVHISVSLSSCPLVTILF
jgi:hypothetical protein